MADPDTTTNTTDNGFVARSSSRKFIFAAFIQVTATVGLFTGKIDPNMYFNISTMTLGIYAGASIADKKLNGP